MALGMVQYTILRFLANHRPAYGAQIKREADGNEAFYTVLRRLEAKAYVRSDWGEPTPQPGGKARRYYQITDAGRRALLKHQTEKTR